MSLAHKLKVFRKALKKSQVEAASLIGVPSNTWNQWENGKRHPNQYAEQYIEKKLKSVYDSLAKVS